MRRWLSAGMALLITLTASACSMQSTGEQSGTSLPPARESSLTSMNPASDDTENGSSAEPTERRSDVREYRDISYDTQSSAQTFDLFLPEDGEGPFPLLVFVHGGGWYSGDKSDGQETGFLKLLDYGYAVASLNYRLSGEAPHPAGLIDCNTALRYLQANAQEFWIDSARIAVAGDSSGGHYALMLVLTQGNPDFEDLTRGNRRIYWIWRQLCLGEH